MTTSQGWSRPSACRIAVTAMVLFCGICPMTFGRTIHVSPDGNGHGGETWITAYKTIIDAVSASDTGDVIWIRSGKYVDPVTIEKSMQLLGGFAGNETALEAHLRDPETHKTVVTVRNVAKAGIKIRADCTIDGLVGSGCDHPSVSILSGSRPIIRRCLMEANSSPTVGGGIMINSASPEIIDCTITGNSAASHGGGVYIEGPSNVLFRNCVISGNSAMGDGAWGGGILFGGRSLVMENCRIEGNYARIGPEFGGEGGGLMTSGGNVLLQNTLFRGNLADHGYGGQIFTIKSLSFLAQNCTILGDASAISWRNDPPCFVNSVLWGSTEMCVPEEESTGNPDITYSCIQGGYPGLGNISDDPKFRDPGGDFRLLSDSPCIDSAGTSGPSEDLDGNPRPVDIAGIGREVTDTYDMGAYEFQLNELPTPTPTQTPSQVDPGHTSLYK